MNSSEHLSNQFTSNITNIYGNKGKAWLKSLPAKLDELSNTYGLKSLTPVENMSFHYVAKGYQAQNPIVIKLTLDSPSLLKEITYLKTLNGYAVPKVITANSNMLIMDCAEPGTTLKTAFPQQDQETIVIVSNLINVLHSAIIPAQHSFLHLRDLLNIFNKDNPLPNLEDDAGILIKNRIDYFSNNLNLPKQRIKGWLYVKVALFWAWSLDDGLDASYWEGLYSTIIKII